MDLSADKMAVADLVINLPKIKAHVQTLYSGAIKNLLGVESERQRSGHQRHAPPLRLHVLRRGLSAGRHRPGAQLPGDPDRVVVLSTYPKIWGGSLF
jgi:hypothetical protein